MRDIVGTWRLVETAGHDPEGRPLAPPYGPVPMGIVTFTAEGRMMAVLCDGRTAMPEGEKREYNSYCGNYSVEGRSAGDQGRRRLRPVAVRDRPGPAGQLRG